MHKKLYKFIIKIINKIVKRHLINIPCNVKKGDLLILKVNKKIKCPKGWVKASKREFYKVVNNG